MAWIGRQTQPVIIMTESLWLSAEMSLLETCSREELVQTFSLRIWAEGCFLTVPVFISEDKLIQFGCTMLSLYTVTCIEQERRDTPQSVREGKLATSHQADLQLSKVRERRGECDMS